MSSTSLPNGLTVDAGHVGNVVGNVTANGLREACGSAVVTGGSVDVATGLATVLYAQVTALGPLSSTAGTVGGFVTPTVQPLAGGSITIRGYDQMGTVASTGGTVFWRAVGT